MGKHLRTDPNTVAERHKRRKAQKAAQSSFKRSCSAFDCKSQRKLVAELKAGSKELRKQSPESCRVNKAQVDGGQTEISGGGEHSEAMYNQKANTKAGSTELRKQSPESCRVVESVVRKDPESHIVGYPDSAIQREKSGSNLCLFYALFNSLPTEMLKTAFAWNNIHCPAAKFESFCFQRGLTGQKGYTVNNMMDYLTALRSNQVIRNFEWSQVWQNRELTGLLLSSKRACGTSYVAFGNSPKNDKTAELLKRLHFKGNKLDGCFAERSPAQQVSVIKQCEQYCTGAYGSGEPHAVSFRYDNFGAGPVLIIHDTKFTSPKICMGLEDIIACIVRINCVYIFKLYL